MKIAIVGGVPESLVRFRGKLIEALINEGHEVIALAGYDLPEFTDSLRAMGAEYHTYPLGRTGTNPIDDFKTYSYLKKLFKREKPDLMLGYTIKPVIWGCLAARHAGVKHVHAMITGLGQQFDPASPALLRVFLARLYGHVLPQLDSTIFQNDDDKAFFLKKGLVPSSLVHRVHGSGVDMDNYPDSALPEGPLNCLMVTRLLAAKGVREYAAAAKQVKKLHPNVTFRLVGRAESGSASVSESEVAQWQSEGYIEYLGELNHVGETMKNCHLYILPSYYGEGVPRSVLEAMSMGRAVLTTDNIGCRDPVEHMQSGLIVPPRDVDALAEAMLWFVQHPDKWQSMGEKGRQIVENRYDVRKVNQEIMTILGVLS